MSRNSALAWLRSSVWGTDPETQRQIEYNNQIAAVSRATAEKRQPSHLSSVAEVDDVKEPPRPASTHSRSTTRYSERNPYNTSSGSLGIKPMMEYMQEIPLAPRTPILGPRKLKKRDVYGRYPRNYVPAWKIVWYGWAVYSYAKESYRSWAKSAMDGGKGVMNGVGRAASERTTARSANGGGMSRRDSIASTLCEELVRKPSIQSISRGEDGKFHNVDIQPPQPLKKRFPIASNTSRISHYYQRAKSKASRTNKLAPPAEHGFDINMGHPEGTTLLGRTMDDVPEHLEGTTLLGRTMDDVPEHLRPQPLKLMRVESIKEENRRTQWPDRALVHGPAAKPYTRKEEIYDARLGNIDETKIPEGKRQKTVDDLRVEKYWRDEGKRIDKAERGRVRKER